MAGPWSLATGGRVVPSDWRATIAAAGVVFCLLYEWTGSLYAPLAAHALFNSVSFGPGVGWTWQWSLSMAAAVGATLGIARLVALGLSRRSGRELSRPAAAS